MLRRLMIWLGLFDPPQPSPEPTEDALYEALDEELAVELPYVDRLRSATDDLIAIKCLRDGGTLPPGTIVKTAEKWNVDLAELKAAWRRANRK